MSLDAIAGRIGQIQSTLDQIEHRTPAQQAPATSTASTGSAASGAALTAALSGAAGAGFGQALTSALAAGPAQAAAGGAGGGVTGDMVAADAQKYVGVPYVWGGTDPAKGMDCSGFVQRVYQDLGIHLPRVVHDQMTQGTPVASLADAKPGDLLIDFGGEHVAIYLGNGKAIDAPEPGNTIQVRDAYEKYTGLTAIRRIIPDTPAPAAAAGVAVTGLDASQSQYAAQIVARVQAKGLPAQAAVDAVSTALQESGLRMYWNPKVAGSQAMTPDQSAVGTDGYSVGLFQQQVNGNQFSWGTAAQAMDPAASTDAFLNRLTAIPNWASLPTTVADQSVQGSAYPDAYAKWESEARQIVAQLMPTGA